MNKEKKNEFQLMNYLKKDLTPVLNTQRNHENKFDCTLQCYGIAKFVQNGILPTGPIPTGSYDDNTIFNLELNFSTLNYDYKPNSFLKFESLVWPGRTLFYNSVCYQNLNEQLKNEAKKEMTGFVHGIIALAKIFYSGHLLYFFATNDEVLYVENQWPGIPGDNTYPFYDSLSEKCYFNNENSFYGNVTYILLGDWYYYWGEKTNVSKIPSLLNVIEPFAPVLAYFLPLIETVTSHQSNNKNHKRKHKDTVKDDKSRGKKNRNSHKLFPTPNSEKNIFSFAVTSLHADRSSSLS